MSATSRPADLVRVAIKTNVLPTFSQSLMLDESEHPFTSASSNIIYTRQTGAPDDSFIRNHDVQVSLFSKENADYADIGVLFDQANAACDYLRDVEFVLQDSSTAKIQSVIEHVTGPYRTNKNRYFYRFTFRVLS